jgi:hypothetical protein
VVIFRVQYEEVILIGGLLIDNRRKSPILSASYVPFQQFQES